MEVWALSGVGNAGTSAVPAVFPATHRLKRERLGSPPCAVPPSATEVWGEFDVFLSSVFSATSLGWL